MQMSNHSDMENDDLHKCLHDIRNAKQLTDAQIAYIRKLSSEDKMKVIMSYDEVVTMLVDVLDQL